MVILARFANRVTTILRMSLSASRRVALLLLFHSKRSVKKQIDAVALACWELQTCKHHLAFGGFGVAWSSKREESFSHLESLRQCSTPNVRKVYGICCRFYVMRKHFPEIITAFVVISALFGNICRVILPAFVVSLTPHGNICRDFTSHLEGLRPCSTPNVRKVSRIWRVWRGLELQT